MNSKINTYICSIQNFLKSSNDFKEFKTILSDNNYYTVSILYLTLISNIKHQSNININTNYNVSIILELLNYCIKFNVSDPNVYFRIFVIINNIFSDILCSTHGNKLFVNLFKELYKLLEHIRVYNQNYILTSVTKSEQYITYIENTYFQLFKIIFTFTFIENGQNFLNNNNVKKVAYNLSIIYKIYLDSVNPSCFLNVLSVYNFQDIFDIYINKKQKLIEDLMTIKLFFPIIEELINLMDKNIMELILSNSPSPIVSPQQS